MRSVPVVTDPTFQRSPETHPYGKWFLKYINDERDLPFVYLCTQITLIVIPMAIALFANVFSGWILIGFAALYAAVIVYFSGPFTLMLHNTSHRKFFKREYDILNYYIPWVLGPFIGQSPQTYFSHHIGMHHVENNLHDDKSTTMPYQRDSFWDFLRYSVSFLFLGIIELAQYFRSKRLSKLYKMVVRGETAYIILIIALALINWQATVYVIITPMLIVRFSMMAGNWGQHAFIDSKSPDNNYRNSITCINSAYNRKCFNDGYHIGHHLRPSMHWTDMPSEFVENQNKYADEKAIVFEGLDFHMVWACLMFKRYDILANRFVNIDNRYNSRKEVIDLLKERTKRIA